MMTSEQHTGLTLYSDQVRVQVQVQDRDQLLTTVTFSQS